MKLIKHDTFFSDPWTDLDHFLENALPELANWNSLRSRSTERRIPLDIYETATERVIRLELPGFNRKEITLELENTVLSVSAARKEKSSESEIRLSRSISIGDDVDTSKTTAELNHGILEIHMPKKEQLKPRQIKIN